MVGREKWDAESTAGKRCRKYQDRQVSLLCRVPRKASLSRYLCKSVPEASKKMRPVCTYSKSVLCRENKFKCPGVTVYSFSRAAITKYHSLGS